MPVLLIAGGSRGIGAATARMAARRGYDVAVNYLNNAKAAAAVVEDVKKSGRQGLALQGDMSVEADIERVFDEAAAALGPITHFVHSSGIPGKNSRLDAASAQTIREVIDVNLYGGILCARAAVRRMSTAHGGKGGAIVMLGSIASVTGGVGEYVFYAAAKGGIDSLTVGLGARGGDGGRAHQYRAPGPDRHRDPRAGAAGAHRAAVADEAAGRARRDRRERPVPVVGRRLLRHRRGARRFRRALGRICGTRSRVCSASPSRCTAPGIHAFGMYLFSVPYCL